MNILNEIRISFYFLFITLLAISTNAQKSKYVTCNSVIKLKNVDYGVRLHSHDVKYGTGSGQQSVTGTELTEDVNSHWYVFTADKQCEYGEPIKCGDVIRLQHEQTGRNLHSHHFSSPLSGNQEISAYGENGVGDSGDYWRVECSGDYWNRDYPIKLHHVDTNVYLSISGRTFGRPINGQLEVVGVSNDHQAAEWKTAEGIFVHPKDKTKSEKVHHNEL